MENFDEVRKSQEFMVVVFYAEWCPYCQRLKPEFNKVSKSLNYLLTAVDGDNNQELIDRYNVKAYPSIISFYKGKRCSETKLRNEGPIRNWIK